MCDVCDPRVTLTCRLEEGHRRHEDAQEPAAALWTAAVQGEHALGAHTLQVARRRRHRQSSGAAETRQVRAAGQEVDRGAFLSMCFAVAFHRVQTIKAFKTIIIA